MLNARVTCDFISKLAESQARLHGNQTWLLAVCHPAPGRVTLGELLLPPRCELNTCMTDVVASISEVKLLIDEVHHTEV